MAEDQGAPRNSGFLDADELMDQEGAPVAGTSLQVPEVPFELPAADPAETQQN